MLMQAVEKMGEGVSDDQADPIIKESITLAKSKVREDPFYECL